MIIPFPQKPRLVITCGQVTETRRHSCDGTLIVRHDPPMQRYFLDYEDGESRLSVWDGSTYAGAMAAAREWSGESVVIRDRTGEYRGRA